MNVTEIIRRIDILDRVVIPPMFAYSPVQFSNNISKLYSNYINLIYYITAYIKSKFLWYIPSVITDTNITI